MSLTNLTQRLALRPTTLPSQPVSRTRRIARFGFFGLVLGGVVAGSVAFMNDSKSVVLTVDGQPRTVHTSAADVKGVLAAAGLALGSHDLLAPGLKTPVHGGSEIVLNRGHLLDLDVDGATRQVWVNANSVDEALAQLGYSANSFVSVSRSRRLDDGVTALSIYRPKKVTFKVDGHTMPLLSSGPLVADAITDAGIKIGLNDRLSVAGSAQLQDGEVITIQRVRYGRSTVVESVPFHAVTKRDPTSYAGTSTVTTAGVAGSKQIVYQTVYVDGKLAGRVVKETTVLNPEVDQVTSVGAKPLPPVVPASTSQQIAASLVAQRGWGAEQFSCLVSLWGKESGWRTNAANPSGAYGIPQALPGSKMASAGADWQTNPVTQITWGLNYIAGVYGTPCGAWAHSQADNWY